MQVWRQAGWAVDYEVYEVNDQANPKLLRGGCIQLCEPLSNTFVE